MGLLRVATRAILSDLRASRTSSTKAHRTLSSLHAPTRPLQRPALCFPCQSITVTQSSTSPMGETIYSTTLDLMPKISSHPALAATQIRCGPRDTFSPSHFKRKRRVGFLARKRTTAGRKILNARKLKGRRSLSH